jgi:GNAT superfamily N-acetyltransferase
MSLHIRPAESSDLGALVGLLQQLSLDEAREDAASLAAYEAAFAEVRADPRQTVLVVDEDGQVAGMACFIAVPNLSHIGRPYAIVEDVVVDVSRRGLGIGEALVRQAIAMAREAGCYKLVLTSNRRRTDAHRFYERLGFTATHYGFRLDL